MSALNDECPALSVILVTPDRYERLRKTMRHLRAQTVRDKLEVVIGAPSLAQLEMDEAEREGFAAVRLVEVGPIRSTGEPRMKAALEATAPAIVFGEDHCFPEPGWAEALIAAFGEGYLAVGATLLNTNPGTTISWASILLNFGPTVDRAASHSTNFIPWHNSGYRRTLFQEYKPSELALFLEVEGILHAEILRKGSQLLLCAQARTHHTNVSLLNWLFLEQYCGSRMFWSARIKWENWSLGKRILFAIASPGLGLVRLRRAVGEALRIGQASRLPRLVPYLVAGAACINAGALAAALLGRGNAMHLRILTEFYRVNELRPEERPLLSV